MDTGPAAPRVVIDSVETDETTTRVRLRRGERVAEARTRDDERDLTAVAHATLSALDELTPSAVTLALEECHHVEGEREVLVVLVAVGVGGLALPHVGSAVVGADPPLAMVKAVLHALNRRLEVLAG